MHFSNAKYFDLCFDGSKIKCLKPRKENHAVYLTKMRAGYISKMKLRAQCSPILIYDDRKMVLHSSVAMKEDNTQLLLTAFDVHVKKQSQNKNIVEKERMLLDISSLFMIICTKTINFQNVNRF